MDLYDAFLKSIMQASSGNFPTHDQLCFPSTLQLISHVAEWVAADTGHGFDKMVLDMDDHNICADRENKPFFLTCLNLAKVMDIDQAEKFMTIATETFCSPMTIGEHYNINHMDNFGVVFSKFSVKTLWKILVKLDTQEREHQQLVINYVLHEPVGREPVFEDPNLCAQLFEKLVASQGVNSFIVSLLVSRMIIYGPQQHELACKSMLAATSRGNYYLVNRAIMCGRIDMETCSLNDTPFLCSLDKLSNDMFREVITSWLPLCQLCDHRYAALKFFTESESNARRLNEKKWLMLLNNEYTFLFQLRIAIAAMRFNYIRVFCKMLDQSQFPPRMLKKLANFSVSMEKLQILKILLEKFPWLAKTHTTYMGPLLHHAIAEGVRNFYHMLKIPEIRNNLDVIDVNGYTAMMAACIYGRQSHFMNLVKAGANLTLVNAAGYSILHMLVTATHTMIKSFFSWILIEKTNPLDWLPNLEIRCSRKNLTALQLALVHQKYSYATTLIGLGAEKDSRYGHFDNLSLADYLLVRGWDYAINLIAPALPSTKRVLHAFVNDELLSENTWFMDSTKVNLTSIMCDKYDLPWPPFDKHDAIKFLKKTTVFCTNSFVMGNEDDCPVCMTKLGDHHHVTNCQHPHRFHPQCISEWFRKSRSKTCPLCRTDNQVYPRTRQVESNTLPERPPPPPLRHVDVNVLVPPKKTSVLTDVGEVTHFFFNDRGWVNEMSL